MLQRALILWLTLLSVVAYFWTTLVPNLDPFTASKPYLPALIALIMFVIGSLLPPEELKQVWLQWPTVLFGTALQYVAMPLLAFACAQWLLSSQEAQVGIILVGCVPGAMASNVLTLMAKGNVSYSVSLTTCATLLSPLVVPLALLLLLQQKVQLDPVAVFLNLLLTVVGPVLTGFGLCRLWKAFAEWMKQWGSTIANLCILWVIAVVVGLNRERMGQATAMYFMALTGINLMGYAIGYTGGMLIGMPEGKRRALTLEIGMQNAGLGATLAVTFFPNRPEIAILPALYTFGCMLTGTVLAHLWSRKASTAA